MARYIDADIVEKQIADYYDAQLQSFPSSRGEEKRLLLGGINYGRNVVRDAPTADVVEVVRCKDCTEWDSKECECSHWYGFRENDFCSYGERRETNAE